MYEGEPAEAQISEHTGEPALLLQSILETKSKSGEPALLLQSILDTKSKSGEPALLQSILIPNLNWANPRFFFNII